MSTQHPLSNAQWEALDASGQSSAIDEFQRQTGITGISTLSSSDIDTDTPAYRAHIYQFIKNAADICRRIDSIPLAQEFCPVQKHLDSI